jgi:hypothetical protein
VAVFFMQIKITLDTGYEFIIDLISNDFVDRWARLLAQEITRDSLLQEDTYSSIISESQAKQRLQDAIVTVNGFLKREFIPVPTAQDYSSVGFYNLLHEKFEKLAGPDWDTPTRLMVIAPKPVKIAVRHINRYCHRLEKQPYQIKKSMAVEFDTIDRMPLQPDDYKLFCSLSNHNTVTLDYSTLGKSLYDCFVDGLPPTYVGAKIQHHYCANFVMHFENSDAIRNNEDFLKWLSAHNITNVPPSELGRIHLGNIVQPDAFTEVVKSNKIQSIVLEQA